MALIGCNVTTRDDGALSGGANETGSGPDSGTGASGDGAEDGPDDGSDDDTEDGGPLLDVQSGQTGASDDGGGGPCGCGSKLEYSYIWVANTGQGTVSKINTDTLAEEGRYLTRSGTGNPSRTSVNLAGTRAAVANRNGGIVAIDTINEACDEANNGVPGLQTSSGANDVLDWGQDDCVAWYTDFQCNSQRPIAWVAGELDEDACEYSGDRVWTACRAGLSGVPTAYLLDGDDGSPLLSVDVGGFGSNTYGGYGGAVDSEGNFWMTDWDRSQIAVVYVDGSGSKVWQHSEVGGYGITVDVEDKIWVTGSYAGGLARFDPTTEAWDVINAGMSSATGIQQGADDRIWTGGRFGDYPDDVPNLIWVDPVTSAVGGMLELDDFPKGISIDADGYVFVVTFERLHKIDPDTMQIVGSYDGLDNPYTYSDMTGWALYNTQCPTPEG